MKVLALNSSARTEGQSKTELLLRYLIEGMREAGAEVEIVNLRDKKIKVCVGCFTCWTKTPGQCVHQDDITKELFPKWLAADICIYATPLFHHTINATMKIFIERTLPSLEPFLLESEDRWVPPLRHKQPAVVVLSVAGFPAMSAFNGLIICNICYYIDIEILERTVHPDDFYGQILSKLYEGEIKCVSLYLAQAVWEDILVGDWHKRAWMSPLLLAGGICKP